MSSKNAKEFDKLRRQTAQATIDAGIRASMQRDLAQRNSAEAVAARQREALAAQRRAQERQNFLNTEVSKIQAALNGLAGRVRKLRTQNGNVAANCGDTDAQGVIPGGSGANAVPYNPGFNSQNRFGVTFAEVNQGLQGFSFDHSDSAAGKYASTDNPRILVHL